MLWWAAFADEPASPARQCAEAAQGTEIEVCLKLAAAYPESADAIQAALAAHVDRRLGPDRELMTALLQLNSADGVQGALTLGILEDTRAVRPLVHAAENREEPVASAAVEALARYPQGIAWLERWLLDRDLRLSVRQTAARALGALDTAAAGDALIDSLRHRGLPPTLRDTILEAVRTGHPHRSDELVRTISRDGTVWLTVTGAAAMGYTLGAAGRVSEPELFATGATAGTVAGGTLGYLIGQAVPTEADDGAFIATNTLLGTTAGVAMGAGLRRGEPDTAAWSGVAGEVVGLTAGIALAKAHRGSVGDSLEAGAIGVATAGAVGGALDVGVRNGLSDPERARTNPPLIGVGIGLLAGTTFGHLVAPSVRLRGNDWALVALSSGAGAAVGTLMPLAGNRRGAMPILGAAAGGLVGFALSGPVDADWDTLASGTVGAVFGGAFVGGLVLWARPDDDPLFRGALLLGGIAGLGAGALLADDDQDPIDDRDVVLAMYATGWVGAHVIAVNLHRNGDPLKPMGPLLALPCLAGGVTSALSTALDVPVTHSSAAVSLGLVGASLGGTIGELTAGEPVFGAILGGDAGLIVGTVILSPLVNTPPTTLALANTGGVLGGGTGLAVARLIDPRTDTLLVGSMIGAGAGFVGGALTGHVLRRSGATRNIAFLPRPPRLGTLRLAVAPAVLPGREGVAYGAQLVGTRW